MRKKDERILIEDVHKHIKTSRNLLNAANSYYLQFFNLYSIADLRLHASMRAVSCSINVLPTERTSIPSVTIPIDNSLIFIIIFQLIHI